MARIKIEAMGGMRPIVDTRQLPDQLASFCANVIVRTGALRPLSEPVSLFVFGGVEHPTARRLLFDDGTFHWYPLTHIYSNILKAPLINDKYERYYILDPPGTPMKFNTKARILTGDPPYLLGMPSPVNAPNVGHTGGTAGTLEEARAYLYTFVDEYGQESPPSPPTVHEAPIDATSWNISGMDTTIPDAATRPAIKKKIYRTLIAGGGSASYYFVAEIPLTQSTYTDTQTSMESALTYPMGTMSYLPPPENLQGILRMPGGFFVGWEGRNLHMCQPYKPWAWPAEYDLALAYQIVGAAVLQQTMVVGTTGHPYAVTGNTPAAMTPSKQDRFEPCISRASIVGGVDAVYYSSANGLIAVNAGGAQELTRFITGRDLWLAQYGTGIFGAGRIGPHYMALNDQPNGTGFLLSTEDAREAIIELLDFRGIQSMWDDSLQDDVLGMLWKNGDSHVVRLSPRDPISGGSPRVYSWRSKEFFLAQPTNFAAYMVHADEDPMGMSPNDAVSGDVPIYTPPDSGGDIEIGLPPLTSDLVHERMGKTSKVGMMGIGGIYAAYLNEAPTIGEIPPGAVPPGWAGWPWWPGVNQGEGRFPGSDLTLPPGVPGVVRFYSNRVLIYSEQLQPNRQMRLPAGFRSTVWQVLVTARIPIYSIHVATHGRELLSV